MKNKDGVIDKNVENFLKAHRYTIGFEKTLAYFQLIQTRLNTNLLLLKDKELMEKFSVSERELLTETENLLKLSKLMSIPQYDSEPKKKFTIF